MPLSQDVLHSFGDFLVLILSSSLVITNFSDDFYRYLRNPGLGNHANNTFHVCPGGGPRSFTDSGQVSVVFHQPHGGAGPHMFKFHRFVAACALSYGRLFVTPWTVARQAPLSMEFSKQEYWRGLPFAPPGDHNDPGIKPSSSASPSLADRFFINCTNWEVPLNLLQILGLHKFSTHFFMDVQECRVFRSAG